MIMWLALSLKKDATVSVLGQEKILPLSEIADGCCGVLLAFDTREQAVEYVGDGGSIIQIDYK